MGVGRTPLLGPRRSAGGAQDRRARRIPATIRYEAFGDVVIDLNGSWGLNVPHGRYTWRVLGERRMLGVLHAGHYPAVWCPGDGDFAPCDVWEGRTALVVEGAAVQPYDSYGKRVVAIDKEAWVVLATDLHDRKGALCKTWVNFWSYRPYARGGADAEEHGYLLAGTGVDFEAGKAIRWRLPGTRSLAEAVAVNTGLTREDFSPGQLGSVRRCGGSASSPAVRSSSASRCSPGSSGAPCRVSPARRCSPASRRPPPSSATARECRTSSPRRRSMRSARSGSPRRRTAGSGLAHGRLAEVAGDGPLPEPLALGPVFATTALEADRQMRALGLEALARRDLALMSDENRALLGPWADGVNAATESGAAGAMVRLLGIPVEPWTPRDSIAAWRLGALNFAFGGWEEVRTATLLREVGERGLADFLPPYPDDWAPPLVDGPGRAARPAAPHRLLALPAVRGGAFPRLPVGAGSNNWVVAGRRTATGRPLLANDPHLQTNPPTLYVAHVSAPGFEAIGTTAFGLGFYQGHNGRVAWGITLVGADAEDLFVEEIAPDDPPRVRTPDGWQPLRLRTEEIRVRGRSEPVRHVVREPSHGPLLDDVDAADARR
jgi:hypothetical protein